MKVSQTLALFFGLSFCCIIGGIASGSYWKSKEREIPIILNFEGLIFSVKACEFNGSVKEISLSKSGISYALCENGAIFKLPDQKNLKNGTEKEA